MRRYVDVLDVGRDLGDFVATGVQDRGLVAALARITGARNKDRPAEQGGGYMVKIFEVANSGHMLRQEIDRNGSLQRQIVKVVIDDERRIASDHIARQGFVPRTAAVHHHPGIGPGAVQNAILDEVPGFVQHTGVGGFAGIDLGDVARRGIVQNRARMRTDQVQLLEPGNVHQARFRADRNMILRHVLRIRPSGAHAVPILEFGPECPMPIRQCRVAPTKCHGCLLEILKNYSGALPGVVGAPSSKGASHSTTASR